MRSCAQYSLLLKLALVSLSTNSRMPFSVRFVVGIKQLKHVRILSNDFTVDAAPLARRA